MKRIWHYSVIPMIPNQLYKTTWHSTLIVQYIMFTYISPGHRLHSLLWHYDRISVSISSSRQTGPLKGTQYPWLHILIKSLLCIIMKRVDAFYLTETCPLQQTQYPRLQTWNIQNYIYCFVVIIKRVHPFSHKKKEDTDLALWSHWNDIPTERLMCPLNA